MRIVLQKWYNNFLSVVACSLGSLLLGTSHASADAVKESVVNQADALGGVEAPFTPLFNGKDYEGWYIKLKDGDQALGERVFAIEDGMIHVFDDSWPDEIDLNKGTDATIGMLYTEKTYDKYHLKFDYKWGKEKRTTLPNGNMMLGSITTSPMIKYSQPEWSFKSTTFPKKTATAQGI